MDLHAYLTKHDGKPTPSGAECIRLATSAGCSPYYLYMTALGHKRLGAEKARAVSEQSIGGLIDADAVNAGVDLHNNNGESREIEATDEGRKGSSS